MAEQQTLNLENPDDRNKATAGVVAQAILNYSNRGQINISLNNALGNKFAQEVASENLTFKESLALYKEFKELEDSSYIDQSLKLLEAVDKLK